MCFAGFVSNIQNRINDSSAGADPSNILKIARDYGQTRLSRLSFHFGSEVSAKDKDPKMEFATYQADVDDHVVASANHIPNDLSSKKQSPIMIEVKASSWKIHVWRQLTAELAAWIYETETISKSSDPKPVMRHKILFTQHGAEIYLIVGSFGDDYIKFIHSNDVSSSNTDNTIPPPDLDNNITQLEKSGDKAPSELIRKVNEGMLHMNR